MNEPPSDLHIAEIPYENGSLHYRYERYLSQNQGQWIRHGLFTAFHPNGALAQEGHYHHGLETGVWRTYHPNGVLAAQGRYADGQQVGHWSYWSQHGLGEDQDHAE